MAIKDKRRRPVVAEISLGKLLIGLRYLAETPTYKNKRPASRQHVVADLSRFGVERKWPGVQNGRSHQVVSWSRLENQLSKSPSSLPLLFRNHANLDVKVSPVERCLIVKFIIGKIMYTIGMEAALLESPTFSSDIYNLVSYRGAVMLVRSRLADCRLVSFSLGWLPSADHGWQMVPMHPDIVELSEYIRGLCVIVLKVNSAESSSSDETPRSTEDSANEDLAMWKVWNWSTAGDYGYDIDPDHMYNGDQGYASAAALWGDGLGSAASLYDIDDSLEVDLSDTYSPHGESELGIDGSISKYVYSKELMLSLRDSPLSRKKPESVDRIAGIARTYNGYMRRPYYQPIQGGPRHHHQQACQQDCCSNSGDVREYSRKFLLSLRYAPLSLRRPSVFTVNTYRHQPSVAPYKQHY